MAFRIMLRRCRTALAFWSCLLVTGCVLTSAEAMAVDCDIVPTGVETTDYSLPFEVPSRVDARSAVRRQAGTT